MSDIFVPLVPPAAVIDKLSEGPVLLIGHWHDHKGKCLRAEVSTGSRPRELRHLAAYFPGRAEPQDAARALPHRLHVAAAQLAGHINAGSFEALSEDLVVELRALSTFLLEAEEIVGELLLAAAPARRA